MKKFSIAVISLVVLAIVAYGIAYFVLPVSSMELSRYTHSVGFVCDNAFVVRDETVYTAPSDGIVYNIAEDGDRVALDSAICTVYDGDVSADALKQLRTIDSKISRLKGNGHDSDLYKTDSDSSEIEIAENMNDVLTLSQENDVEQIHEIKNDINGTRKGNEVSDTAKIDTLTTERNRIEKSISARKSDIISDRSGIFSSYVDGLETVLTPDKIEDFTTTSLKALEPKNGEYLNGKKVSSGKSVCKVMNNHVWYIIGIADSNRIKQLEETPNVTIRFSNMSETDVPGEVSYISSPDADGNCIFMIEVGTYVETAFSYRKINAQIIFKEYSGYKVPTDAIRTRKDINQYYVCARKGSESYECDVEVLYSDPNEGYSIIQSTEDADNKLGSMERLIVGER